MFLKKSFHSSLLQSQEHYYILLDDWRVIVCLVVFYPIITSPESAEDGTCEICSDLATSKKSKKTNRERGASSVRKSQTKPNDVRWSIQTKNLIVNVPSAHLRPKAAFVSSYFSKPSPKHINLLNGRCFHDNLLGNIAAARGRGESWTQPGHTGPFKRRD